MRALVTGGGGFIGSHLVTSLLSDGHDVRVLDNFATGRRENLFDVLHSIDLVEGDVQSYERAHTAVRGCDVVFHQAALPSVPRSIQDPLTSNASNVIGTLNVLLAARDSGVRRVVFASSSSIYGTNRDLPKREEMPSFPISPYAAAKQAAEGYCRSFSDVYGLQTICLRYFNVFGPRQDPLSQYAAVIPNFITAILRNESPIIFGDGEQTRDFTYIDNVVQANLQAAGANEASGQIYNIAVGERISLNHLVDLLRQIFDREIEPVYAPARPGEVRDSLADVSRAERELGYSPKIHFEEGLRRTVEFHRAVAAPSAATLAGARA
jgi:UDP-N-acetylglucosamine/UDP-N-acetyl-alpha-D-glucosaminouronate 4-epimerase